MSVVFFLIYLVLWGILYYLIKRKWFDLAALVLSYCVAPLVIFFILYKIFIYTIYSIKKIKKGIKDFYIMIKDSLNFRYNRYKALKEFRDSFLN